MTPINSSAVHDLGASETAECVSREASSAGSETGAAEDASGKEEFSAGVTVRVVFLSLLLAVAFGYLIPLIDVKFTNTYLGATHLPPGAIAVLLILLLIVNPLLKLVSARFTFSRNETLTVYTSCLFSCLVPGHGAENFFVPCLVGPFYYATRENGWLAFLQPYVKPWFTPALNPDGSYNAPVTEAWYTGIPADHPIPWGAWLVPLFAWGLLIVAIYTMLGCLSVMLRAQWSEKEALAFPLLRLPLEMTADMDHQGMHRQGGAGSFGSFFGNKSMWAGFLMVVFIQLMNGLRLYFPDVPGIPLSLNMRPFLTEAPWNQLDEIPVVIFPVAVAVTYLLTSETSFSLWFFYWFMKFQLILAYTAGFTPATMPKAVGNFYGPQSFLQYQQVGAYLAYAGLVVWLAREHLSHVFLRAIGRRKATEAEKQEALSYPVAFWGFVLSLAVLIGWSVAAGISLPVAMGIWLAYLVIAIALTRVVVEGGLLFVQQGWTPLGAFAQLTGSGPGTWLPASSLVPASFLQISVMCDLRAFVMPSFVQSFRLAHNRKIHARQLLALIAAVTLISLAMSLWMNVRLGYRDSGLTLNSWFAVAGAQQPGVGAEALAHGTANVSWTNWLWMAAGVVATISMMAARSRYLWFPLHPIGLLMSLTYPMMMLWFSVFLGWLSKVLITRFGGNDTYRKSVPFFMGLALGDVTMMLFWLLIDGWQGHTGHVMMPG